MISIKLSKLADMLNGTLVHCKQDEMVRGVYINTREHAFEDIFVPIIGENFDAHEFVSKAFKQGAKVALFQMDHDDSSVKQPLILVKDTRLALGQLAKAYLQRMETKVVGVTGSNGKTSTKDIITSILSPFFEVSYTIGNRNNDIGLPLTILESADSTDLFVLEMGMSALKEIEYLSQITSPDIGVITSIGSAHLNDLGSMDNIVRAKLEITSHMNKDGVLIVNGDDERLMKAIEVMNLSQKVITYGFKSANDYVITEVNQFLDNLVFQCRELTGEPIVVPLLGKHQALNTVAALLVGKELNVPFSTMLNRLASVELTGGRTEVIELGEAIIIDDSYKSNPEALAQSLHLLDEYPSDARKIAVLGDMLDLGEDEVKFHQDLSKLINNLNIDRIYTIGHLAQHFHDFHSKISHHFGNQEELIEALEVWLQQPSVLLFKGAHALKLFDVVKALRDRFKTKESNMKKVAVLFGGKSSEYLVSLSSTASVLKNFPTDEFEAVLVGVSEEGRFYIGDYSVDEIENNTWMENESSVEVLVKLGGNSEFVTVNHENIGVDVAFNMIHGKFGEDGVLQALLKAGNISYTGCDAQSSILAYDKDITHRLLDNEGILKAKYRTLTHEISEEEYEDLVDYLGRKVILKPAREGSSYGISIASDYETFKSSLKMALEYDTKVVVEEFIEGFEVGASILEKDGQMLVGDVDEIELHTAFFDYEAKYAFKDAQIVCPARISEAANKQVKETAKLVFNLLGCRDFSRIDFFCGKDGMVYFNEINTIPGFTSHSRYPNMMKGIGIDYKQIIATLIENAIRRK